MPLSIFLSSTIFSVFHHRDQTNWKSPPHRFLSIQQSSSFFFSATYSGCHRHNQTYAKNIFKHIQTYSNIFKHILVAIITIKSNQPENVMLLGDNSRIIKLIDFGLSRKIMPGTEVKLIEDWRLRRIEPENWKSKICIGLKIMPSLMFFSILLEKWFFSTPGPWDAWNTGVCVAWGRLYNDDDHDDHDDHDHGGYDDHDDQDGDVDGDADKVVNYEPLSLNTDLWSIGVITYIMLSGIININVIMIFIYNYHHDNRHCHHHLDNHHHCHGRHLNVKDEYRTVKNSPSWFF